MTPPPGQRETAGNCRFPTSQATVLTDSHKKHKSAESSVKHQSIIQLYMKINCLSVQQNLEILNLGKQTGHTVSLTPYMLRSTGPFSPKVLKILPCFVMNEI